MPAQVIFIIRQFITDTAIKNSKYVASYSQVVLTLDFKSVEFDKDSGFNSLGRRHQTYFLSNSLSFSTAKVMSCFWLPNATAMVIYGEQYSGQPVPKSFLSNALALVTLDANKALPICLASLVFSVIATETGL